MVKPMTEPMTGALSQPQFDVLYALEMQDLQNVSVSATSATTAAGGGPA